MCSDMHFAAAFHGKTGKSLQQLQRLRENHVDSDRKTYSSRLRSVPLGHQNMPHPCALTSNFVLHGCETLPMEKRACDERNHLCCHGKLRNFLSVPDLKKQRTTTPGGPYLKKGLHDMSTVVAADLTAATPVDRRQIIADWRKPKFGRLWKSSLASHAQLAANAVDMLESVNVLVASRKSERSTY